MENENSKNENLGGFAEINLQVLSDSQLYQKCKKYGENARLWMRKFEGLLPEVCRRRLYRRRGFTSIHEFGAKLAGMSHPKVDRILQLSVKLEDKPKLREAFESGKVGYSKVARVAYVAKPETDEFWAEKVQIESQFALNLSVNKEREKNKTVFKHSFQSDLSAESGFRRGHQVELQEGDKAAEASILAGDEAGIQEKISAEPAWTNLNFHVAPEVERKFRALKQKLEKQSGETMSYGEVLGELIEMVEKASPAPQAVSSSAVSALAQAISQKVQASSAQKAQTATAQAEKQITIKICPDCAEKRAEKSKSRTVPIAVKRLVLARQNNQCAHAHCTHPPSDLHHINGYALTGSHSPEGLEYLCEKHHKLAHAQHEFVQVYRRE